MTAIITVKDKDGTLWMGSDGLVSCDIQRPSRLPKQCIKKIGTERMLIGSTGAARDQQIVQHLFTPTPRPKRMSPDKYMTSVFTVELLKFLMANERAWSKKEEQFDSYFMVAYAGRIYFVDSAAATVRTANTFDACGSGASVALGVLEATRDMPARKRIRLALRAAEKYVDTVQRPFTIQKI